MRFTVHSLGERVDEMQAGASESMWARRRQSRKDVEDWRRKPPVDWSSQEVALWLQSMGSPFADVSDALSVQLIAGAYHL